MTAVFLWLLLSLGCTEAPPPAPVLPGAVALSYQPTADEPEIATHQASARSRGDAGAWTDLALALWHRKRATGSLVYREYADDAAAAALAVDPDALPAQHVRIRAAFDRHRFAEAAELAAASLVAHPHDATLLLLRGDALLELGAYDQAAAVFQRAVDARPDLRTLSRAAHVRWLHGDLEGAVELAVAAVRAGGPAVPEPTAFCYVDLATLELRAGRPARARRAAEAALALVPDYPAARAVLARAWVMSGTPERAVDLLLELAEDRPQVADLALLSELLLAQGREEESARWWVRATTHAPPDPRALAHHQARVGLEPGGMLETLASAHPTVENLDTLALALWRAGDTARAAQRMEQALALGTADARLHLHRGLIAATAGDLGLARRSRDQADALNPRADPRLRAELDAALR